MRIIFKRTNSKSNKGQKYKRTNLQELKLTNGRTYERTNSKPNNRRTNESLLQLVNWEGHPHTQRTFSQTNKGQLGKDKLFGKNYVMLNAGGVTRKGRFHKRKKDS